MKKINYIQVTTSNHIAQIFADYARGSGYTSSDLLRQVCREAMKKAGFREHSLISPPIRRELNEKNVKGKHIQAEVHPDAKKAFRRFARNHMRTDMQKAVRSLLFDFLVDQGEDVTFDMMHHKYQHETVTV